ncbi:hypothetical protein DFH08DRAFT_918484 [Mycena albidolilacea]|uniref:Uncharacterized protein n=1 Tax=Mycena albidolilacea TaxID=1033008 RepID=A0AAD6Z4G5_9AGAR|nr:hypothetical protein DFH08DRAFT_918484 [Mycena albidolilacea]
MAAVPQPQMPARGDRNAPQFDSAKPRELPRYFSDLEFHFTRASVVDSTEKKRHATRFLSVEDQDVRESFPEFGPASTFDQFQAAVLKLYPGTDSNRKFTLADLDTLVGEYARVGILSRGDYSEFYRQFLVITQFLFGRECLSIAEQSRSFFRAIAPAHLWARVHQRLQIKKPDVHPDDPYALEDLHEAVQFVLADTSSGRVATSPPNPTYTTPSSAPEAKQGPGITALLETMNGFLHMAWSYCSEVGHFIIKCEHVEEDILAGKCKCDAEGRVTLPSGAFVPRRVEGLNLRARIEEWYRQNPGQLAAAQLMLEVATEHLASIPSIPTTSTFVLSEEDRIRSLEPAPALAPNPTAAPEGPRTILKRPATRFAPAPAPEEPEHPFANARDAAYAPPPDRNIGARHCRQPVYFKLVYGYP